jgi:hypothetical protein
MLSIKGIYDGKKVYPTEAIKDTKKYKVIITFVEEITENEEESLRSFGTHTNAALEFWNNPEEDIYQDYLTTSTK